MALGSAVAPLFGPVREARADDNVVVFAGWGGVIIKSERAQYFDAFEKATGIKVIEVTDTNLAKLKTMAETGNAEWDLVQALGLWLPPTASKTPLWEPVDYSVIDTDGIPDALKLTNGVGVQTFATTLAYNTTAFAAGKGPASWADLFDLKKFPGKRGMYNSPRETLEVALMSDGVPKDKLYPSMSIGRSSASTRSRATSSGGTSGRKAPIFWPRANTWHRCPRMTSFASSSPKIHRRRSTRSGTRLQPAS